MSPWEVDDVIKMGESKVFGLVNVSMNSKFIDGKGMLIHVVMGGMIGSVHP
jgi:hypothetical protein